MNYVFNKIRETWGDSMFQKYIASDEKTLFDLKAEWGRDFLTAIGLRRSRSEPVDEWIFRCKDRVDTIFAEIRTMQSSRTQNWDFPSLRRVCSYIAHWVRPPEHRYWRPERSLPDKTRIEAARATGEAELAKMKKLFSITRG